MVKITKEDVEYLGGLGFNPNDPMAAGLIEARRVERRLSETAKNLELAIEGAGAKVTEKLINANKDMLSNSEATLTKTIAICAFCGAAVIVASLYIVAGMVGDFRGDRNAGYDVASRSHMSPTDLMMTLSFIEKASSANPDFWQWVQRDGQYFYTLYRNNGDNRCEQRARIGETQGCFFRSPIELSNP